MGKRAVLRVGTRDVGSAERGVVGEMRRMGRRGECQTQERPNHRQCVLANAYILQAETSGEVSLVAVCRGAGVE